MYEEARNLLAGTKASHVAALSAALAPAAAADATQAALYRIERAAEIVRDLQERGKIGLKGHPQLLGILGLGPIP